MQSDDNMDISEVVSLSRFLLLPAASWVVFRRAKRVGVWWLRLSLKTLSSIGLLVGSALALLVLTASILSAMRVAPLYSPDRRHIAVLTYALQGAFGDDYAMVGVRPYWRPWTTQVYSGLGNWNFEGGKPRDPEVRWLDSGHLLIRYSDERKGDEGRGGPALCVEQAGKVQIICQSASRGPTTGSDSH
jgi:hypothetical protein